MISLLKFLVKITTLFLLFIVYPSKGQEVLWAKNAGGSGNDNGIAITSDPSGSVYVLGDFFNTASFGSKSLTASSTLGDLFVAKYDTNGSVIRATKLAYGKKKVYGTCIGSDAAANVYVGGYFLDTMYVNSVRYIPIGGVDGFIIKLDSAGTFKWIKFINGAGKEQLYTMSVLPSGDFYVAGNYSGVIKFNATTSYTSVTHVSGTSNSNDIFIARYNTSGTLITAASKGGNTHEYAYTIAVDSDKNVFLSGRANSQSTLNGTCTIDTISFQSTQYDDYLLMRFDENLTKAKWVKKMTFYLQINQINVNNRGSIFVAGAEHYITETSIRIGKYDYNGVMQWEKYVGRGNSGGDRCYAVASDTSGNVYFTGCMRGSLSFDTIDLDGGNDIFFVKYNATGKAVNGFTAGAATGTGYSILSDPTGNRIFIGGTFSGPAYFNGNDLVSQGNDVFLTKIGNRSVLTSSLDGFNESSSSVFPNPASQVLYIRNSKLSGKEWTVQLFDSFGELVLNKTEFIESDLVELAMEQLAPGNYYYRLSNDDEKISGKLMKQ